MFVIVTVLSDIGGNSTCRVQPVRVRWARPTRLRVVHGMWVYRRAVDF